MGPYTATLLLNFQAINVVLRKGTWRTITGWADFDAPSGLTDLGAIGQDSPIEAAQNRMFCKAGPVRI